MAATASAAPSRRTTLSSTWDDFNNLQKNGQQTGPGPNVQTMGGNPPSQVPNFVPTQAPNASYPQMAAAGNSGAPPQWTPPPWMPQGTPQGMPPQQPMWPMQRGAGNPGGNTINYLSGHSGSPSPQANATPPQMLTQADGSQIPIYSAQNPIPQAIQQAQQQANAGNDRTLSNWGSWQNTPAAQNVANSYFFDASSPNANGTFGAPSQGSGSGYSGPQPTTNPFTGMPMSAAIPAPPQGLGQGAQPTFSPFPTQGQQALPAPATAPSPQTGQLTSASPQRISQALQQS